MDEPDIDDTDESPKTERKGPNWPTRWPGAADTLDGLESVDRFDDREIGRADT
jgi:hypothetical protein